MAHPGDSVVLLEDAWTDYLCIEDNDGAKVAITMLLLGEKFNDAFEAWVTGEDLHGRSLRQDYVDGFEQLSDEGEWKRVVVGGWVVVYRPLSDDERANRGITIEPVPNTLRSTVVCAIQGRAIGFG